MTEDEKVKKIDGIFTDLLKELNDKDCPQFVMIDSFVILNIRNITKIIFDSLKNYKETINDPFVEIYSDDNESRIKHIRISVIINAIKSAKREGNDG